MPPPHHRHPPLCHSYKPLTLSPAAAQPPERGHNEERSAHDKDTGKEKQAWICIRFCVLVVWACTGRTARIHREGAEDAASSLNGFPQCRRESSASPGRHERQTQGEKESRESTAPTSPCGHTTGTLALYVRYAQESTAGALLHFKAQSHPPRAAQQVRP